VISGGVALKDLVVKNAAGAPLLSLRRLDVVVGSLDPLNGKFVIDRVSLESQRYTHGSARREALTGSTFSARNRPPRGGRHLKTKRRRRGAARVVAGRSEITGGALRWRDESHGEPFDARVDGLAARLRNVDSKSSAASEFDLAFSLDAEPWVKLKAFSVQGGRFDLAKREVLIGEVAVRDAMLLIRRSADGSILFVEPPSLRAVEAAQEDSSKPWKLTLAKYRGENLGLRFEDPSCRQWWCTASKR
jgi:hypothetical protein